MVRIPIREQCRSAAHAVRTGLAEIDPSIVVRDRPRESKRRIGSLVAYAPLSSLTQREHLTKALFLWLLREFGPTFEAACVTCRKGVVSNNCPRYPVGAMLALGRRCEP